MTLNEFQRGAANIAIRANVPIRPVIITCTPSTLTKNEKWYHVPSQPFHIEVKVLDAVQVSDLLDDLTVGPKQVRQLSRSFIKFLMKSYLEMSNLADELKQMIIDVLALEDITIADIDTEAPLFGEGLGLDSIDALELGLALKSVTTFI